MAERRLTLREGARLVRAAVRDDGSVVVDDADPVTVVPEGRGRFRLDTSPPAAAWASLSGSTSWVFFGGEVYAFDVEPEGSRARSSAGHHHALTAPMPATVARVQTEVGAAVGRGDTLLILEAMKMELPVRASSDGIVKAIHCREGELVQPGKALIEIG